MSSKPYIDLSKEASCDRIYRGHSNYSDEAAWYASHMSQRYPDTNWQEYTSILSNVPGHHYDIKVKHMIQWGRSDARIIEDAFQVQLPDSVHEFYQRVTEAVFFWRKTYHFLCPTDVVLWEREIRHLTECEHLPNHFITFCRTDGDYLGFRFNPRQKTWTIFYYTADEFLEDIQSPANDESHVCEKIDDLLQLLMQQDGLIEVNDQCYMERLPVKP